MVREIYGRYGRPLARVVHGLEISWNPVIATRHLEDFFGVTAWSPCNRFIAVGRDEVVDIRDAVTLILLNTLKSSRSKDVLRFSPDSRLLTEIDDSEQTLVTWDLQTGGSVVTNLTENMFRDHSSTYSKDGNTLAVAYSAGFHRVTLTTHDLSTTRTRLCQVQEGRLLPPIWIHGDFLRFATGKPESITIWQAEFALTHPPEAVESFPAPDGIADADEYTEFLFLPSLSRLAISLEYSLSVWDVRDSKLLLKTNFGGHPRPSFSSDGRFCACTHNITGEVHLWKESPAGYVLHQKIAVVNFTPQPCLSPNGESILIPGNSKIHLRHTRYPILLNRPPQNRGFTNFTLVFSPDDPSAAFACHNEKTVTVLDLQSGDQQLAIDTDMEVRGLGFTGNAIVVVDWNKVGTWSLTAGEAGVKFISDIVLDWSQSQFDYISTLRWVSPDLSHIIVPGYTKRDPSAGLDIYSTSTGSYVAGVILEAPNPVLLIPWFTPDGRQIWGTPGEDLTRAAGWQIIEDSESGVTKLQPLEPTTSQEPPWQSSRGYRVTDDGWILSSTQRRLLWLPHRWRSGDIRDRRWNGRFLGLLHGELPEIVILEFCE